VAEIGGLGKIQAITGVNGETFVCVDWRKQMLGMSPARARELAAALLAVAGEAETIDAQAHRPRATRQDAGVRRGPQVPDGQEALL
jgi:proline racemase